MIMLRVSCKHFSGGGSNVHFSIGVGIWCRRWWEQLVTSGEAVYISSCTNKPASIVALHTPLPLSLTFTEKKGESPIKPKHKHVLSGY